MLCQAARYASDGNVKRCYHLLNIVLRRAVDYRLAGSNIHFGGLFAKTDFLCKEYGVSHSVYIALNDFRHRKEKDQEASWQRDVRCLTQFVTAIFGEKPPLEKKRTPQSPFSRARNEGGNKAIEGREGGAYFRLLVDHWDDGTIYGRTDEGEDMAVPVPEGYEYFIKLLRAGDLINVVGGKTLIYQPDYLVDISSVAACFESYADTPYIALLNRLKTTPPTRAIHMGNLASQFLDEVVHGMGHSQAEYAESVRRFFHHHAIDMAAAEGIDASFHNEAMQQLENIHHAVHDVLEKEVGHFDASQVLLEPSFFCETLGLQGRMDLLQRDFRVLIEQKSGKGGFPQRDPDTPVYQEKHYVQMLLYMELLKTLQPPLFSPPVSTFSEEQKSSQQGNYIQFEATPYDGEMEWDGRKVGRGLHSFLLYSKYKNSLVRLGVAPDLLHRALMLRNQIAYCELSYARGDADVLLRMTPDGLRRKQMSDKFWTVWVRPELERILTPIQTATPLEQAYFLRMLRFVATEHVLSKMGNNNKEDSGFAAKWHSSLADKLMAGNIIDRLEVAEVEKEGDAVTSVLLRRSRAEGLNFRQGDIVALYAYEETGRADALRLPEQETGRADALRLPKQEGREPDIRKTIVHRGTIAKISNESDHLIVSVRLRAPQSDETIFSTSLGKSASDTLWALEHDFYEASTTSLFRSLHQFLSAPAHRKALILGQRSPEVDTTVTLRGDYGEFNPLVLGAMQAKDLFLVVGPPGTGKTSFGLLNILKEQLLQGASILLMAYTNRAVDEICSKLVEEGIDFLRIGSELSCEKVYRDYLLENKSRQCSTVGDIRQLIAETSVFVGTTTAVTSAAGSLFRLKTFDLAIIDEASQILEPQLLGLLGATDGVGVAIKKFILIGDHKQLPAVVQQSEEESKVTEQCLLDIGLTNCRNSLFERLYNTILSPYREEVKGDCREVRKGLFFLSRQGRMHGDIADFPNHAFYEGKLGIAGLPHQLEEIKESRLLFIAARHTSDDPLNEEGGDKTNHIEAHVIAREAVRAVQEAGDDFDPLKTVGVIVPYRSQIAAIRQAIAAMKSPFKGDLGGLTIDTVERFQGSQRDVIIYGFTVQYQYQLKFLSSATFVDPVSGRLIDRRLNVALTRAKKKEIIVGNPDILSRAPVFRSLIQYCKQHHCYVEE